jgi:hypothetical protein
LGTALRLIGITLGSEELLLASGKGKIVTAVYTGEGLI